eukprot:CAMPEP_0117458664 /NCGR_PEP_ID=MMETSP0784-20121206/1059_1 /TAXON_ID=39447 /ORGANISM="" /LENGTH=714 /DNA_ID=CAMNT_0005252213 /DNA_START=15 /DNA_END=2159 /DNA_ORIENTATION=+
MATGVTLPSLGPPCLPPRPTCAGGVGHCNAPMLRASASSLNAGQTQLVASGVAVATAAAAAAATATSGRNAKSRRLEARTRLHVVGAPAKSVIDAPDVDAALYEACRHRRSADARRLLSDMSHGTVTRSTWHTSADTPFSWACWWGLLDVVRLMTDRFPEEVRDAVPVAISQSCRGGQLDVAEYIIDRFPGEARAVASREFSEACLNRRQDAAWLLVRTFPEEVVHALSWPNEYDHSTALHGVCRHGLIGILRSLLKRFPEEVHASLGHKDQYGKTALAWACENKHEDIVQSMLEQFPGEFVAMPPEVSSAPSSSQVVKALEALPKMIGNESREILEQQRYRVVGSHSAVKQCRWTKHALRGEGQCYKHTFYGISSHRCMEGTPSLACANKCTFCWRNHANPVSTSWNFQSDDPEWIVQESVLNHLDLVAQAGSSPVAIPARLAEARSVGHMALSLVGEPVLYPRIAEFVESLHRRRISTFVVTNGQFPDELERLPWVTQLYVSVDAPTANELRAVGRPLFRDHWQRLRRSLEILREKGDRQRTVCRMTLLKAQNMGDDAASGYAELLRLSECDFVEVKGATWSAGMEKAGMAKTNVPVPEEVRAFAEELVDMLPGYGVACEHEHSTSVLLARRDKFLEPTGRWRTWIDFERFADAAIAGAPLDVVDFTLETPEWALARDWNNWTPQNGGFDPEDLRIYRRPPPYTPRGGHRVR